MNQTSVNPHEKMSDKKKLNWKEKKSICEQWKVSGKNKSQFCKEHGLSLQTFCGWCDRLWPRLIKRSTLLTPVCIAHKEETEQQIVVELSLPNQATVKISVPLTSIGSLIKELWHATAIVR